jgi:hypothetical protein
MTPLSVDWFYAAVAAYNAAGGRETSAVQYYVRLAFLHQKP